MSPPDSEHNATVLAVEALHIGLWSVDLPDGAPVWNTRMQQIVGRAPPASWSAWLHAAVHADDQLAVREALGRTNNEGTFDLAPIRVEPERGGVVWVRLVGKVLADSAGVPVRVVGAAMDVSDMVLTQERLARSAQLATLGHFSAGVSHNFNNMLMVIMSCLEVLHSTPDLQASGETRGAIADALDASRRAADVVKQLANLARPNSQDAPVLVRVPYICAEMGRLAARVYPARLRFVVSAETQASVRCVPGSIEQVLTNVLINARDALLEAGTADPTVRLHAREADSNGERTVQIIVRDNGPGVDDDVLERIFEPFVTTKGAAGSGLGLATAAAIMERQGGHIFCRNRTDGGAEFLMQLPAASETGPPSPGYGTSVYDVAADSARVLVVDDEPALLRLVGRALGRYGFEVDGASTIDEAEALVVGGSPYDLVLLDRTLGTAKGEAVVPLLRQHMPDCRILFFTGEPLGPVELAQVDGVLYKPVGTAELVSSVRAALATTAISPDRGTKPPQ